MGLLEFKDQPPEEMMIKHSNVYTTDVQLKSEEAQAELRGNPGRWACIYGEPEALFSNGATTRMKRKWENTPGFKVVARKIPGSSGGSPHYRLWAMYEGISLKVDTQPSRNATNITGTKINDAPAMKIPAPPPPTPHLAPSPPRPLTPSPPVPLPTGSPSAHDPFADTAPVDYGLNQGGGLGED